MSLFPCRRFLPPSFLMALLAGAAVWPPSGLAQTNVPVAGATNAAPAVAAISIPQSTFDPKVRRDPFFPESQRLNPRPVAVDPATAPGGGKVVKPKDPTELLRLNGITGSKKRRFAAINGSIFGLQEESIVKTSAGEMRVKVIEIRERSVIVNVDGATDPKEIFLKED